MLPRSLLADLRCSQRCQAILPGLRNRGSRTLAGCGGGNRGRGIALERANNSHKGRLARLSPITCCGYVLWLYAVPGSFGQVGGTAALEPLPVAQEATQAGGVHDARTIESMAKDSHLQSDFSLRCARNRCPRSWLTPATPITGYTVCTSNIGCTAWDR